MKVRYLGQDMVALCRGKVYDVMCIEKGWYRIMTEINEDYLFPPDAFEIMEEANSGTDLLHGIVVGLLEHTRGVMANSDPQQDERIRAGRSMGCCEMLDILVAELKANNVPLDDYGLADDLQRLLNP